MHHHYTDVAAIFFEYFYLAHDIIMLLPPESKNEEIIHSVHKALRTSTEYVRHASVEIQNIYDSEVLVGKILFYGEVSDVKSIMDDRLIYPKSYIISTHA